MRRKEDMANLQNKMNLEEEQRRVIEYFEKLNGKGLYQNNYGNNNNKDDEENWVRPLKKQFMIKNLSLDYLILLDIKDQKSCC